MKNSTYLIILLALGLVFTSYKWVSSTSTSDATQVQKSTIEDIMTRTSVRSYSDKAVEKEKVIHYLERLWRLQLPETNSRGDLS